MYLNAREGGLRGEGERNSGAVSAQMFPVWADEGERSCERCRAASGDNDAEDSGATGRPQGRECDACHMAEESSARAPDRHASAGTPPDCAGRDVRRSSPFIE